MIQEYCKIVLSNLEKGIYFDEEESILLREWGLLNDTIISLKNKHVQQSQLDSEGDGLGI
jgi:hypothetical protein